VLRDRAGDRITACGPLGRAGAGVRIGGFGRYRGSLVARNAGGTLQVMNALGVQGYVKGVVAGEVPSSWPAQALRAQAVVARSYGLATARGGAFDHYADTRSQVYGGRAAETKATNRAVAATATRVVTYRGKPAVPTPLLVLSGRPRCREFGLARRPGPVPVRERSSVTPRRAPMEQAALRRRMEPEAHGLFEGRLGGRCSSGRLARSSRRAGRLRRQHGDQRRRRAGDSSCVTWARFVTGEARTGGVDQPVRGTSVSITETRRALGVDDAVRLSASARS
jgi:hypothetical protein